MSQTSQIFAEAADRDAERRARERRMIEQARASVAAGFVIPDDRVDAWLDRMVDEEGPLPIPGEFSSDRRTKP